LSSAAGVRGAADHGLGVTVGVLQRAMLWLMLAAGWFVVIEPAPFDLIFVLVVFVFLFSGLAIPVVIAPLILFLLVYNFGGFISYMQVFGEPKAYMFVVTSIYMAVMAIFLAVCIPADPLGRMAPIRNGWIIAGGIASITGLIGYFNVGGMQEQWAPLARAQGTFKDPNVMSTFIIAPAIFLVQGFMLGTQKWRVFSAAALGIMLMALFLAFSRGAWINFMISAALLIVVTFVITPSLKLRSRIVLLSIAGTIFIAAMLIVLLSFETTRNIFQDRFSLIKDYDVGEYGRFGRQAISLHYLLDRPWGFGPTFFRQIFGQDPHNVYIHAFSSYGWIGGFTYPLLIVATIAAGWKAIMTRTPWQNHAIACFCPLVATMFQGIQIDTDHWRHFYLLLGLTWGFYAATVASGRARAQGAAFPQA
jgi:hypothetical protein